MDSPQAILAGKFLSITPALLLGGYQLGFSQNGVSNIYEVKPQTSTPVFRDIFNSGLKVAAPCSTISALSSSYLAYVIPEKRNSWVAAAAMALSIGLWTTVAMSSGINRLIAISNDKALQDKSEQTLEHRQLLTKWVRQNYVRVILGLGAGVTGLWASLT